MVGGVAAEATAEVRATTLEIRTIRDLGESNPLESSCGSVTVNDDSSSASPPFSQDKLALRRSAERFSQGTMIDDVSSLRRPGTSNTQPERKPLGMLPLNLAAAALHNEPPTSSPGSMWCAPLEMPGRRSVPSLRLGKPSHPVSSLPSSSAPSSPQESDGRRVTCPDVPPVRRGSVRDRVSLFESKMTPSGTPAGTPAATPRTPAATPRTRADTAPFSAREKQTTTGSSLPVPGSWSAPKRPSASPMTDWVRAG